MKHSENVWAIVLLDGAAPRFLTVLDCIATRRTRRECEATLRQWRKVKPDGGRAKIVRVLIQVL